MSQKSEVEIILCRCTQVIKYIVLNRKKISIEKDVI